MALTAHPAPARARRADPGALGHQRLVIETGWQMAITTPGKPPTVWHDVPRLGTVAAVLRDLGQFKLDDPPRRFDADEVWFRCRLPAEPAQPKERLVLGLDGLATIADVLVDGTPLLRSENMFLAHEIDVTGVAPGAELTLLFHSLDAALTARRPRPRWRAPMIAHQQLRYVRTTLLGRTPGWSPPVPAVGPWRPVWLERRRGIELDPVTLQTRVDGADGWLTAVVAARWGDDGPPKRVQVVVEGATGRHVADAVVDATGSIQAQVHVPDVARWWPHTHGDQPRYSVAVELSGSGPCQIVAVGQVGFRALRLQGPPNTPDEFRLVVNDVPIFFRGACWTPPDVVSLTSSAAATRQALEAVRDAGMNMVRIVGSMTPESDVFHEICDELGICVWHDLMFANMDYPEDEAFVAQVSVELAQTLSALQGRPSVVLVCGDSEGEQQAAMWGAARDVWERPLFRTTLAAISAAALPDVPYWPSSASGGAFPHDPSAGTTSYYGVGAYLRPLDDARRSGLRFASECLAFANVPEDATLDAIPGGAPHAHTAAWKARSPRDLGAGWDFDDVRDAYVGRLFGVDPTAVRWSDHERYLQLGRVATGEVMAAAFAEWRRPGSLCGGALVWFLRDLWPGAGWGVVDARGRPKAAFHCLRRALAPVSVAFTDEGLAGLRVHLINDRPTSLTGTLEVRAYRRFESLVDQERTPVTIAAHRGISLSVGAMMEGFRDLTYAYRFGPPAADLVVATLNDNDGQQMSQAFFFPTGMPAAREGDLGFGAEVREAGADAWDVVVRSRRLALAVAIDAGPLSASDAFFHVAPGGERRIRLVLPTGATPARTPAVVLAPLNAEATLRLPLPTPGATPR